MRTTIDAIAKLRATGSRFAMITAYDYTSAQIVDRADVPLILVGDSLGMVVHGHGSTLPVTLDDMITHTRMVVRGSQRALVVTDIPFADSAIEDDAVRAAVRLMAEGGCQSVKIEGARTATIRRIADAGIPVMAHLGFTPQSVHAIGMRVQGRGLEAARRLYVDALAVQEAGAWAVVLELVPAELATAITERLDIPTIGIGAGAGCSGQVQVWHDLLGLYDDHKPRHARRFRELGAEASAALDEYAAEVRAGTFPGPENTASMDAAVVAHALEGAE